MKLIDLDKYHQIVIQLHDNPDADAVGSGYAMYEYFKSGGKDVRMIYGGANVVSKSNMKLMISELGIPLVYVGVKDGEVTGREELGNPELLITVDCQYGEGNVQLFDAQNVAVIDHHRTGRQSGKMAEIRSNLISCATVCYELLTVAGFEVNANVKVATALYYGLYMDSNQLSEINHPLDRDMVDFLQYDKGLINRLKYANFNISELETAGAAITGNKYLPKYRVAIVKSEPCDPNILGVIGDFVIQVDVIDVCIIYSKCPGGYKFSIRSCLLEVTANELIAFITAGIGNGGGHLTKAGGFINGNSFRSEYGAINMEMFLNDKIEEYYDSYDVIYYNCDNVDLIGFAEYRKKQGVYGYVRCTDMFAPGTECKVRTLEGDVFVTSSDEIYLMIGYRGETYPIEKSIFEKKYRATDNRFCKEYEYAPSIINVEEGKSYDLMSYAKECVSLTKASVMARQLEKYTKVFTKWDYESYMTGIKGDMLCYVKDNLKDVYVVTKDIFLETYCPISEKE